MLGVQPHSGLASSVMWCSQCEVGLCGYQALYPRAVNRSACVGHLAGWGDHTGSGSCADVRFQDDNAITRWIYTAWDWVTTKCYNWNAISGREPVTNDHCARLLYLVATDITDANLEPDTAMWYIRSPAVEVAA
jgi:hypothetical protein